MDRRARRQRYLKFATAGLAVAAAAFVLTLTIRTGTGLVELWRSPGVEAVAPNTATPTAGPPPATITPTPTPLPPKTTAATGEPIPTPTAPAPTNTPAPPYPRLTAGSNGVNVRTGPSTAYERIGYLEPGTIAEITGRTPPTYGDAAAGMLPTWWQIRYGDTLAWASGDYVLAEDVGAVPAVPVATEPGPHVIAGAQGVNVRRGPGTTYAQIGHLEPGQEATVTGRNGEWWQIDYLGEVAWVSGNFTTPVTVGAVPEVPTPVSPTPTAIPEPLPAWAIDEARWIDVDITNEWLTAYEGTHAVKAYLVSTGLPQTPTPTGQYRIWIKLRYDDMTGPGYYIEDVPWVMYFYEGYGLHGVTWHANFGHPMSHGCVNQPNDMAEWLFNFAEVGTLVNIHE